MQNLETHHKVAFVALAIAFLVASLLTVILLGGTTETASAPAPVLSGVVEEASPTQETVKKETTVRCRNPKTGRFIKCP